MHVADPDSSSSDSGAVSGSCARLAAAIPGRSTMAQGLLSSPSMSMQHHRIHRTWPLYLAIAIGGAASIATSQVEWRDYHEFTGEAVTLGPDRAQGAIPFTIRFSPVHGPSTILVIGDVVYEDAAEELRVEVLGPGKVPLATQVQAAQGDGNFQFQLRTADLALSCEPIGIAASQEVCEQELALAFGTSAAPTGSYVINWFLRVENGDYAEEPPPGHFFAVEVPGGREVDTFPFLYEFIVPPQETAPGRWRASTADSGTFFQDPGQPGLSRYLVVRGAGPYTSSELAIPFMINYDELSPGGEATLRISVVPDEPAAGQGAEHLVTVTGSGSVMHLLSVPGPLDCAGESVCERGFTLTIDTEGDAAKYLFVDLRPVAAIEGDGDAVPAGAFIEIDSYFDE
jgi:hypothetical protein